MIATCFEIGLGLAMGLGLGAFMVALALCAVAALFRFVGERVAKEKLSEGERILRGDRRGR